MSLWEYSGKHVKITDVDGGTHVGFIEFYSSELDEPDGMAVISLRPDGTTGYLTDFTENDIENIDIVPVPAPEIAVAG